MKIIAKERGQGKTTELIKLSAETGDYIVCHSMDECGRIAARASRMKLDIPFPISYGEIKKGQYGPGVGGVLLDNADDFLRSMIPGININGISVSPDPEPKNTG